MGQKGQPGRSVRTWAIVAPMRVENLVLIALLAGCGGANDNANVTACDKANTAATKVMPLRDATNAMDVAAADTASTNLDDALKLVQPADTQLQNEVAQVRGDLFGMAGDLAQSPPNWPLIQADERMVETDMQNLGADCSRYLTGN